MATKINQKEYLKKYLCSDKEKKKRKKKEKKAVANQNVRIIDDDLDLSKLQSIQEDELDMFGLGEEAPQVVGIIDERPPEMRAKEDFGSNKWKVVAASDGFDTMLEVRDVSKRKVDAESNSNNHSGSAGVARRTRTDSDESPPRKHSAVGGTVGRSKTSTEKGLDSRKNNSLYGPLQSRRDSDESSARRQSHSDRSKNRGRRDDSDESPPRKSKHSAMKGRHVRHDTDNSPPRKSRQHESNESFSRSQRYDSGESPPRRTVDKDSDKEHRRKQNSGKSEIKSLLSTREQRSGSDENAARKSKYDKTSSRVLRHREDSDESPPRRGREMESTTRRMPHGSRGGSSRRSPRKTHRRRSQDSAVHVKVEKNRSDSDLSPPRKPGRSDRRDSDESPPRRRRETSRVVPPVRIKDERASSADESPVRDNASGRMTKTLEGKRAGLQDARALREENDKHKRREAEAFEKMAVENTGRFAETVVRQKSGRRKDIEKELREEFEKRKHEEKKKDIYTRWGKGVKQTEEYNARLQEAAHEMEKPLARYADDKDLDEHLKQQEREGDPMLEYLRSKRKEENRQAGIPEKPTYQGAFPDNRYGIRPGYRWDGVDRSNGFEKRWFETMSKKKATEEEAYKYSVEDM